MVSVSSDEQIRKIKSPPRPIQNENERAMQLANLRMVDEVFICDDDTGAAAILKFRPQIFVRGVDYRQTGVDEREAQACREIGCEVRFTETDKYSSSDYVPHY